MKLDGPFLAISCGLAGIVIACSGFFAAYVGITTTTSSMYAAAILFSGMIGGISMPLFAVGVLLIRSGWRELNEKA